MKKIESTGDEFLDRIIIAKSQVINQSKNRVSRRLLLAKRSTLLTCVCADTGIVSLLEVPAIPGFALTYSHPLANYSNARGIAQKGIEYLNQLETQVLAGILVCLAEKYSLFQFQPTYTGAQKNAILRTAGKDVIINAIILIEKYIHSGNCQFLPRLSLAFDSLTEFQAGASTRLSQYLKTLVDTIIKPDYEPIDQKVTKISKPLFIKDTEAEQRTISFLARSEIAAAKKEYAADKRRVKKILSALEKAGTVSLKMKQFIAGLFSDDAILSMDLASKATIANHPKIQSIPELSPIVSILSKDRSRLTMDVAEIKDIISAQRKKSREADYLPEEIPMPNSISPNVVAPTEGEPTGLDFEIGAIGSSSIEASNNSNEVSNDSNEPKMPKMPDGLSPMQQILWRKKFIKKQSVSSIPATGTIGEIEVKASYQPSDLKEQLAKNAEIQESKDKGETE